ncbi:hypothetical protein [Niabella drilacis]|uniref:Uncharacterized protein n=1 Tax=Niabella drilacis (strain DSM 25811 / CCM 8410 / CCUG 62505 / LMG 26954 / E90) TaxID=1285928 RepID=A0A1G6QDG7_NIADE|nr:hypothetical protein [Niabella drilacis]SDC89725.1 hypothetical protein SAMN04487894_104349 [Niabella drilacis]
MRRFKLFMCCIGIIALPVISSCGKDKTAIKEKEVAAVDLLNYYMALEIRERDRVKLRLVCFPPDYDNIMAAWNGPGFGRLAVVTLSGNRFSFDVNGNSSDVFDFSFSKDDLGNLSLKGTTYKGVNAVQIQHVELFRTRDIPVWAGKTFRKVDGPYNHLAQYYFSQDRQKYYNVVGENGTNCYPKTSGIGFHNEHDNLLGVFVPAWKGDANIKMLLEDKNIVGVAGYKYN